MTDIVKRLRTVSTQGPIYATCDEAADEILRLRKAVAIRGELSHALGHIVTCETGTKLCPDCQRLAERAIAVDGGEREPDESFYPE